MTSSGMSHALLNFWLSLHLSNGEAAQIFIAILSSAGALAAAIAAWRSARATAATVQEMRESRLLTVRPALVLIAPRKTHLYLGFGEILRFGPEWDARGDAPVLEIRNLSANAAIDLHIDWWTERGEPLSEEDASILRQFFLLAKLKFEWAGSGEFAVTDRTVSGCTNFASDGFYARNTSFPVLEAGGTETMKFDEATLFWLASNWLAARIREHETPYKRRFDAIDVSYASISGERIERKFNLTTTAIVEPIIRKGNRRIPLPEGTQREWTEMQIFFTFDLFELGVGDPPLYYVWHLQDTNPTMFVRIVRGVMRLFEKRTREKTTKRSAQDSAKDHG